MQSTLTIILVHGALLGSGGWDKTVNHLQSLGHNAIVLDLPGRAGDTTDPKSITLKTAAQKVVDVMKLQAGKVVLVGHSQGGLVISQAAEMLPEKVQSLVYVTALLPKNGQTLGDIIKDDKDSLIGPNLVVEPEKGTMHFNPNGDFRNVFAQDVSVEEGHRAFVNTVHEPLGIGGTPVELTEARFGRLPRTFVLATEDRVLTPWLQEKMIKDVGVDKIVRLATSHSPFLSQPQELAKAIVSLAGKGDPDVLNTVKEFYKAFEQGEIGKVRDLMDKDIVWNQPGNSQISGTYRGKEAVLGLFGKLAALSGGSLKLTVESLSESNGIVSVSVGYSARRPGTEMSGKGIDIYKVKNGKIVEASLFTDNQKLEDAFWDFK